MPKGGGTPPTIISNHVGWADILVHMALYFPSFVAKSGLRGVPLVGAICESMQCLFVERGRKQGATEGIADSLKQRMLLAASGQSPDARPVLIFAEGTTTNGDYLLDFRSGAFLAGTPVQPVILRYQRGRLSHAWETIGPVRHIFLTLCQPLSSVTAFELPVYVPSEAEKKDPKLYASNVRLHMNKSAKLQLSSSTLKDKKDYQALLTSQHSHTNHQHLKKAA
ncbi:hypothetical protein WJX84_010033 [Apatococcus fuscideae]|uniref:Phospholipid/glycerol acyltransferase domain-containing protein n=1 Tax=Apatococcus fuscideae TaxID=2026836 RepID=A0AAW1TH88_9CHLO